MYRKVIFIGCMCLLLLTGFSAAALNLQNTSKIFINLKAVQLTEGYDLLNYKDHLYIPLRFFGEAIGSDVFYNEETKSVNVTSPVISYHSAKSNEVLFEGLRFTLFKGNEVNQYWAELANNGDKEIHLTYQGNQPIRFGFEYADDKVYEAAHFDVNTEITLKRGEKILSLIPAPILTKYEELEGKAVRATVVLMIVDEERRFTARIE